MAVMSAAGRASWLRCFAPVATLEDPVGSDGLTGVDTIGTCSDTALLAG